MYIPAMRDEGSEWRTVAVVPIDGQSYRLQELGALLSPIREGARADSRAS